MSSSSTISSLTLIGLPTELLIQIFQSVDTFATASALSKTSHRLQRIWETNATAIFPHVVPCYPQAHELATAQTTARHRLYGPSTPHYRMTFAQRITDNHILATMTSAHFSACVSRDSFRPDKGLSPRPHISPSETATFTRAHYRALTLATLTSSSSDDSNAIGRIPRSFLDPLDLLSYLQLREAIEFMQTQCQSVTLNYGTDPPTVQLQFMSEATAQHLQLLDRKLQALPGWPGDVGEVWEVRRPFWYFCVEDGFGKEEKKKGKGKGKSGWLAGEVKMAELLAVIGERGWYLS